jgi:hypothetical protein
MRRRLLLTGVLVALSVALAEGGGLFYNLAADRVPSDLKRDAPWLLTVVVVLYIACNVGLFGLEATDTAKSVRARRSVRRKRTYGILSVMLPLLGAASGFLGNVAASALGDEIKGRFGGVIPLDLALALFIPGVLLASILIALLLVRLRSMPHRRETDRTRFLEKLQRRYKKRQRESLHGSDLLVLGLRALPGSVADSEHALQTMDRDTNTFQEIVSSGGATIDQVYDAAGGRLLLLGDAGAGKSTYLLELARSLLERAQDHEDQPLPVLFNLATWAINRLPFADWLVEELVDSYDVPRALAREWVTSGTFAVLPLLDGLDEIQVEATRGACVDALNAFLLAYRTLPLVVSSRTGPYLSLPVRLHLAAAVEVQPLTDEQIRAYLASGGERYIALRTVIDADSELRDILRVPLLLSLVTQTYLDTPRTQIPPVSNRTAWRRQLFADYVDEMLERARGLEEDPPYSSADMRRYLAWLGAVMRGHGQVEFFLERLQPSWLPDARARVWYRLICVLIFGGTTALVGLLVFSPIAAVAIGLLLGLAFGLASEIRPVTALRWSWRGLYVGVFWGLLGGILLGGLLGGRDGARAIGVIGALISGLIGGLNSGQVDEHDYSRPNEGTRRSLKTSLVVGAVSGGLLGGLLGGLVMMVAAWQVYGQVKAVIAGLLLGVLIGLIFGLFLGLVGGLIYGGRAVVQHFVLRTQLRRTGAIPARFVAFLDFAAEHFLLQKSGGSYRFIHILLRDYFADLGTQRTEDAPAIAPGAS